MKIALSNLLFLLFAKARKALAGGLLAGAAALATNLSSGDPINWGLVVAAFIAGWGGVYIAPRNKE